MVGLDLSLTSTGVSDGARTEVFQTEPGGRLEARMDFLVRSVRRFVSSAPSERFHLGHGADLAVIESGAFSRGAQSEAAEILSALRLMVRHRLWLMAVPYAMVAPTTLKAWFTGNGKATKPEMVAVADARHGTYFSDVPVKKGRYDLADALGLAAMGYARIGQPLVRLDAGQQRLASLDAVKWPDLLSD